MIVDLMDYVIIERYACGTQDWKESFSTMNKVQQLVDFSFEVASVFIAVGAHTGDWQRYYESRS